MHTFNTKQYAFTIVELLVVIVVIGILASISIVAYNGIQVRALNSARLVEMKAWNKQFQIYRSLNGQYPGVASGDYCLGTNFPNGNCRDYHGTDATTGAVAYDETQNTVLMNELATIGTLPSGPRKPVSGTVGPYISFWGSGYYLEQVFESTTGECADGTKVSWYDDSENLLICYIEYLE